MFIRTMPMSPPQFLIAPHGPLVLQIQELRSTRVCRVEFIWIYHYWNEYIIKFMCIYIYTLSWHIYIYYWYRYIHINLYTYISMYMYLYIYTHVYIFIYVYTLNIYIYIYIHKYIYIQIARGQSTRKLERPIGAFNHTDIYIYIYIYIHMFSNL